MNENFSHEVKAGSIEIHHTAKGTVIHKTGCSHGHRKDTKVRPVPLTTGPEFMVRVATRFQDDYYDVAPCARRA